MQKSMYKIPTTHKVIGQLDYKGHSYPLVLRDLPAEEKPREKLLAQGPEALSVKELTALLLITGTVKEDVLGMVSRIARDYGEKNIFVEKSASKLASELDIPLAKACQIVAAGELGRRFYAKSESTFTTIHTAQDVFNYVADMRTLPKEHLRGLYLNVHNRVIRDEVISIGTVSANIIHPREIFRTAIECNAVAMILVHNHPSGEPTPSSEDVEVTKVLIEAGKIVGIHVLDHVIVTKDTFASVNAQYN